MQSNEEIEISLTDILAVWIRRWKQIAAVTIISGIIGGLCACLVASGPALDIAKSALSEKQAANAEKAFSLYQVQKQQADMTDKEYQTDAVMQINAHSVKTAVLTYDVSSYLANPSELYADIELSQEEQWDVIAASDMPMDTTGVDKLVVFSPGKGESTADDASDAMRHSVMTVSVYAPNDKGLNVLRGYVIQKIAARTRQLASSGTDAKLLISGSAGDSYIADMQAKMLSELTAAYRNDDSAIAAGLSEAEKKYYEALKLDAAGENAMVKKPYVKDISIGMLIGLAGICAMYAAMFVMSGKIQTVSAAGSMGIPVLCIVKSDVAKMHAEKAAEKLEFGDRTIMPKDDALRSAAFQIMQAASGNNGLYARRGAYIALADADLSGSAGELLSQLRSYGSDGRTGLPLTNPEDVKELLHSRTAVILVRTGVSRRADVSSICDLCQRNGIAISGMIIFG